MHSNKHIPCQSRQNSKESEYYFYFRIL